MDTKRPLSTQVPSQTDVGVNRYDYLVHLFETSIGLRFEFDGYEKATFDPSSISNGCWDQKLARVAAWCGGG
eukprot:scaffold80013_cov75-Attheya_sp.AAC.2